MDLSSAFWTAVVSGGVGAVVGAGISAFNEWRRRLFEGVIRRRELAATLAVKNYELDIDWAKTIAGRGGEVEMAPLDTYLIHMLTFMDQIGDAAPIDEAKIKVLFAHTTRVTEAANKELRKHSGLS